MHNWSLMYVNLAYERITDVLIGWAKDASSEGKAYNISSSGLHTAADSDVDMLRKVDEQGRTSLLVEWKSKRHQPEAARLLGGLLRQAYGKKYKDGDLENEPILVGKGQLEGRRMLLKVSPENVAYIVKRLNTIADVLEDNEPLKEAYLNALQVENGPLSRLNEVRTTVIMPLDLDRQEALEHSGKPVKLKDPVVMLRLEGLDEALAMNIRMLTNEPYKPSGPRNGRDGKPCDGGYSIQLDATADYMDTVMSIIENSTQHRTQHAPQDSKSGVRVSPRQDGWTSGFS